MNDIERAIEELGKERNRLIYTLSTLHKDLKQTRRMFQGKLSVLNTAISALEKQMLKPVKITKPGPGMTDTTCSICGKFLDERAKDDYCYGCGQKLDWSVEE